ncbi:ribonuclease T2 [Pseudomonas gingeri]|uniref:ribonuclease T2 family protein n=1 Tax=Pseudomonas gingeri TaxID=117681 RepID=UPI0015A4AD79|nr:ribonuclease T2 [Pseudomonas gingeri]NWA28203.1 ribonuclease T2 [Pseudomonas gingeri]NWD77398.1 ribonuclease T2 [Pseudomonas gingeri]
MKLSSVVALLIVLTLGHAGLSEARQSRPQTESVAGVFDYYLLTLSWSPTFCLTHANDQQCSGKGYGFVLHGLWPQYAKGGWPQSCEPLTPLTQQERQKGLTLFPSGKLLQHEWNKHGTCSGLGASGYLNAADKALGAVVVPPALQPSTTPREYSVDQIVQLFRQSNPGMPEGGVTVRCSGPELAEVRVCLTRDLGFGECGKGVRNQCRQGPVRVPAIR